MTTDAVTTLSLVTLATEYRGDVVRQINRRTGLLKMLRIVPGGGPNIAWAPEGDGALAETYAEGADAVNFGRDVQDSAVLNWAFYRSAFHVTKHAMDSAATSSSPVGNRQLWARNLVNSAGKLASYINQEAFAGPGTGTRMGGLATAILDSNDYAGIDPGSETYWKSTVVDPGTDTDPTFALLRDDLRLAYEASGMTPDQAVTTPAVFNKIGALFDATRRQFESVNGGRGPVKLEFGFQALEVDGTVFFKDKDCTAKTIYYMNSDYIEIQYLPSAEQNMLLEAMGADVTPDDGFGSVPLGFSFEMLAKTGPASKAEVLWTGQLKVSRRNTHAVRAHVKDS
jgi:hypothetical protein